jgi:hypothetical protein
MSAIGRGPIQTWTLRRATLLTSTLFSASLLPGAGGGGGVFALSSTNATLTSAAGADPQVDLTFGSDIFPGFYLRIQRSSNGVQDGSGNYTAQTLNIIHAVTETERAAQAIPNANLTPDGYVSPTGAYWQRYRWEREDGAFGPWSEVSGTVTVSVNQFTVTTGVDKSAYLNVQANHLSIILNNNVGSEIMARATTAMSGKTHAEYTVDGWYTGTTNGLLCGVTDAGASTSFATFGNRPGASSHPGASYRLPKNATALDVLANGGSTSPALGVTAAVGDKIITETDPSTNTVKVYYWDASANGGLGALVNSGNPLATTILTGVYIPAAYYGFAGGYEGTPGTPTTANSDSMTANYGSSTFSMTPTTGYVGW